MANAGINLKSLLLGDTPDATISTCTAMASSVARHSSDALPEIDWPSLAGDIGEKIGEMFDIPLVDLLIARGTTSARSETAAIRAGVEQGRTTPSRLSITISKQASSLTST